MSVTTLSLIESLLQHDRPVAWWGLDTADPLVDDSGNGYTLTALATPTNATTLHTRGDTGASGCRDFNGTTGGYFTAGSVTTNPEGPPAFHASAAGAPVTSTIGMVISPGGIEVGDLMIFVALNMTPTSTVTTAPAGWTIVNTLLNAGTHAAVVYRKTATSADTFPQEYKIVWNTSAPLSTGMLVYRGADPSVSGLIFDSNRQVTASSTFHSSTTETYPNGARQLVIWTRDAAVTIDPDATGRNDRLSAVNANGEILAVDYEKELAGSQFRVATTTAATTLGVWVITFGAPSKVLDDALDTVASNLSIGCLVNPDTVAAGTRTIVRKHQAWGLHVVTAALTFVYRDGGGVDRTVTGPNLAATTTQRIWVVDDGTNINFYVNGTKTTAARTGTAGYTMNANRISIAHYNDTSTNANFFDGRIDELAIFSAALTEQMVRAHEQGATQGTFGEHRQADKSGRFPRMKLELAIDGDATARCPAFSDVTGAVRVEAGIQTARGRNFELDRMQAGTMSFLLSNRDRAYDALRPTRVVRFRAQVSVDGPVFPIFYGYTDAPKFNRPSAGLDSTVSISATDTFRALSLDKVRDVFVRPTELAGERIASVLEDVPGLLSSLDTAVHEVIGDDLQGVNRLEHCQAVADTDGGVFFADARGRAVFQDNQYRSKNERTVRAIYGGVNTSAPLPCKELAPEVDEGRLYTAAAVTPSSGNVQRAVNEAAALEFFERTKEVTTLHSFDSDAQAMADHIVAAYSEPLVRIPNLVLQPAAAPSPATMWALVLGHEISHRIKSIEKPIGGTSEVAREHFIEGVAHSVSGADWQVNFSVSPTELEGKFFIVGTSAIGDSNAVIGW